MLKKTTFLLPVLFGLLAFSACKEDKDDEAPTISVASPQDHTEYEPGESIQVKATFSDNEELSEYKIDLHVAGDHSHKRESEWDYETTGALTGTNQTIELTIDIPADTEHGEYHLNVECLDKEGNEADIRVLEIHIEEE